MLHELFGTSKTPGRMFPEDESAWGFDVVGEALTTTSAHVDAWEAAAADVIDEVFGTDPEQTASWTVQAEGPGVDYEGDPRLVDGWWTTTHGSIASTVVVAADGAFALRIRAKGRASDGEKPRIDLRVDDVFVAELEVETSGGGVVIEQGLVLSAGAHRVGLGLANPGRGDDGRSRTLTVDSFELVGPLDPEGAPTAARDAFVPCAKVDRSCAAEAIARFERRAWRRTPTDDDVTWALGVYDDAVELGEEPGSALELAFRTVLLAPDFLFRIEAAPDRGEAFRRLEGPEIATRLARFLWSSVPDERLLDRAESDGLDDAGVRDEVRRMLADPRASALVDDFAGQWLDLRDLADVAPDRTRYPEFDEVLRQSMVRQLTRLARDFLRGRITLAELIDGDTELDARLAEHIGIPWEDEPGVWVRTPVYGRPGILGTPGWLTTHSHADRPSAVKRGRSVLADLLCAGPPLPPPDVVTAVSIVPSGGSVRQQEEGVRAGAMCQSCHRDMDSIGYVFHGFDAVGADRAVDELGYPIDDSTALASDPEDLAAWLVADDRLATCVARQTLIYALERPLDPGDDPTIEAVTASFIRGGLRFDALAEAVATSDAFLYRGRR